MRKCGKGYKTSTELKFCNIFGHLMRFYARANFASSKLPIFCSWHARKFAKNPPLCFFVSEWLIPLKYPLYNYFNLYYYLITNSTKKVDISVSSKVLTPKKSRSTLLYTDIFYNTLFTLTLIKTYFDWRK